MKRSFGEVNHSVNFNVANVLVMLSRGGGEEHVVNQSAPSTSSSSGRIFKCKTCCRQFPSFQALGGHRASHKKPTLSGEDNQAAQAKSTASAKAKAHECSICGLEFAIGQALGGHMRRHRAATTEGFGHGFVEKKLSSSGKRVLLDLNLPPFEDIEGRRLGVELGLGLGLAYSLDSYI